MTQPPPIPTPSSPPELPAPPTHPALPAPTAYPALPAPAHPRKSHTLLIISFLICFCLLLAVCAGLPFLGFWKAVSVPTDFLGKLAELTRSNVDVHTSITTTVDRVQKKARLEVMQADITAEVEKKEQYKTWIIYWGTSSARVRARGCKVQYVVPLEHFSASDIAVDTVKKTVTVTVPEPRLNTDIVEVNYANIEVMESSSAWARFNKGDITEEAKRMLRDAAIEQGKSDLARAAARENARAVLRDFLQPFAETLRPDVHLEIEFKKE